MSTENEQASGRDSQSVYRIRIEGHLHDRYAEWFEGMTVRRLGEGQTLLIGSVVDQAALHALLRKVRDLGLTLVSVDRFDRFAESWEKGAG